ncbi:adenosylcobinamide-GDP ribazoletransferase [Planococcus sp. ISL-109]|uniref:adenosylcobinamide-GDP ribazoletransferase n=1 Tax=Planococcus sp. ISL-109 TaxID=2819166 RepID=UPI001BE80C29|nr:adenosylcobinamide-GDP ribazoletransferase [Planococcus sp. ISL-109]MBT2583027.1 adenosylcobinamide-GDP ribazoletransferase [Planococcus sp. ISL-109]
MANRTIGGLVLAFQFFSAVPIHKQVPVKKPQVTAMYAWMPFVGASFGVLLAGILWLLRDMSDASPLLIAFILAAALWALTGGLHMDGLADTGDAYFSYQDRTKRLDIMGDPRIGAFGVMVLIFAIAGKIILLAELIPNVPLFAIAAVPIISRIGLVVLFNTANPAKKDGLAAYFKNLTDHKLLYISMSAWSVLMVLALLLICGWPIALAFVLASVVATVLYKKWCEKNFGGVTGDLLGAFVEGMELLLWGMLLFFV